MQVEARTAEDEARASGPPRTLGRYRVIAELGRGSTSIVYLAAIVGRGGFSKLFALKRLRAALAEDPASIAMFLTEARIGAQLNHPNVVTTLEIEEGDDLPFIVMEYLDGEPLQKLIAAARLAFMPLPLHMQLAALSSALEGLGHAHAVAGPSGGPLGIVHRDVSPHNVFVTSSGVTKVLDFGFAQTVDSPNTMLSSANRVAYMSPEQANGETVDARADLFGIGLMMWEAATRRRFWPEEATKSEILRALRDRDLPSNRISGLARTSEELRSIIVKATDPDPAQRYVAAPALQADLLGVLAQITPERFAMRDLGQRVVTLFAADRTRLQRAIDEDRENALSAPGEAPPPRSERPVGNTSLPSATESPRPPAVRSPRPPASGVDPAGPSESVTPVQPIAPLPIPDTPSGPLPSFPLPVTPTDPVPAYPTQVAQAEAVPLSRVSLREVVDQAPKRGRVTAAILAAFVVALGIGAVAASRWRAAGSAPDPAIAAAANVAPGTGKAEPPAEPSPPPPLVAAETAPASMQAQPPPSSAMAPDHGASPETHPLPAPNARARSVFVVAPARVVHIEPDPAPTQELPLHNPDSPAAEERTDTSGGGPEAPHPAVARPPHPIDSNDPYSP